MTGDPAPDIQLAATGGATFNPAAFKGQPLVIYFYPKDNTPGCTQEGQDFRDLWKEFGKLGCAIVGVSRDSLKSHENFKAKYGFPFELASDPDETACSAFGVIKDKVMYGKKARGVERSTFVVDARGVVRREWRGVKVSGHAKEVLEFVGTLE